MNIVEIQVNNRLSSIMATQYNYYIIIIIETQS